LKRSAQVTAKWTQVTGKKVTGKEVSLKL